MPSLLYREADIAYLRETGDRISLRQITLRPDVIAAEREELRDELAHVRRIAGGIAGVGTDALEESEARS